MPFNYAYTKNDTRTESQDPELSFAGLGAASVKPHWKLSHVHFVSPNRSINFCSLEIIALPPQFKHITS